MKKINWKLVFKKEVILLLVWSVLMLIFSANTGLFLLTLVLGGTWVARLMVKWDGISWIFLGILPLPVFATSATFHWWYKFGVISESVKISGMEYAVLISLILVFLIFWGCIIRICWKYFPRKEFSF